MNVRLRYFGLSFWRAEASQNALFLGSTPLGHVEMTKKTFRSKREVR